MPVMDGYGAAAALRKERVKPLVLIAHSALTEPGDIEEAHRSGFDHHLAKPFDSGKLRKLIASSLGTPEGT